MDLRTGIQQTAQALGINPIDLATAISYETAGTFDPTKRGPTTQWGQHRGLIQFGEPQAQKYGVNWDDPIGSQLGPDGAVARYLRDTGVRPGMGLLDIYSAINAGGVGRYGASDANNGGAPGTVRDKVEQQMAAHRRKAQELFEGDTQMARQPGLLGNPVISTQGQAPEPKERWWNDDRRDRLILGLEGMTLNPNRGLMMAASQGLQERAAGRKEAKVSKKEAERRNRTAQWLASRGRTDLAEAVAGGMIDAKSAVSEAIKPPADDRTAMQKNYEFLIAQGIPEDQALQMARSGQTINLGNEGPQVGTIPQGYQLIETEAEGGGKSYTMAPIPGGPADTTQQDAAKGEQTARAGSVVIEDIGRVRKKIEEAPWYNPVTGEVGRLLSKVGGTDAFDVGALLRTIGGNIGFDRLQQMRDASPTGGALGAINQQELNLLMSVMGSLEQAQSDDQLLANLDRLNEIYTNIMRKAAAYPNASEFGFDQEPAPKSETKRLKYNPETGEFE